MWSGLLDGASSLSDTWRALSRGLSHAGACWRDAGEASNAQAHRPAVEQAPPRPSVSRTVVPVTGRDRLADPHTAVPSKRATCVSLSTRPRFGNDWAERGRARVACSMEVEEGRRESGGAQRLSGPPGVSGGPNVIASPR